MSYVSTVIVLHRDLAIKFERHFPQVQNIWYEGLALSDSTFLEYSSSPDRFLDVFTHWATKSLKEQFWKGVDGDLGDYDVVKGKHRNCQHFGNDYANFVLDRQRSILSELHAIVDVILVCNSQAITEEMESISRTQDDDLLDSEMAMLEPTIIYDGDPISRNGSVPDEDEFTEPSLHDDSQTDDWVVVNPYRDRVAFWESMSGLLLINLVVNVKDPPNVKAVVKMLAEVQGLMKGKTVIVLGDTKVGKTNIVSQFNTSQFDAESKPTMAVRPTNKVTQVGSSTVKVNIWDIPGLDRYRAALHPYVNYYDSAVAVLLVYDITNRESFENVSRWLKEVRDHGDPGTVVMLVGNKSDLGNLRVVETHRAVRTEEGALFARKNKIPFAEISARYTSQVESAFKTLLNSVDKKISAGSS
ncbi:rab other [Fusarium longipes]|uniref:Rab other n=1 Tax=Fusarium longipes TaxID=694270 RepID=A0A395T781_9HYPO|nr:rab other [Fusarium longipes]